MMKLDELIHEAERLPAAEKWQLVKQLLRSLEAEQQAQPARRTSTTSSIACAC